MIISDAASSFNVATKCKQATRQATKNSTNQWAIGIGVAGNVINVCVT